MRFDIDYPRAKTMATRLQNFLSENPKPKLTRSSSIEAVARMLGFNNLNEMSARLDKATDAAEAPSASEAPASARTVALQALDTILHEEIDTCAHALVRAGKIRNLEHFPFMDAMHEDAGHDNHALIEVEDEIEAHLHGNPDRQRLLQAALAKSAEIEGALQERPDEPVWACARALVNESLTRAEEYWGNAGPDDTEDRYDALALECAQKISRVIREDSELVDDAISACARSLAKAFPHKTGKDPVWDIRHAFEKEFGMSIEDYETERHPWLSWDVDVSCWVPGSLLVELPDDHIGEIQAEVLCMATIQIDASDDLDALDRAREQIKDYLDEGIWNPRPDRGVRNARWVTTARDGDAKAYIDRQEDLVEDHWQYDYSRARDFTADQIADMSE